MNRITDNVPATEVALRLAVALRDAAENAGRLARAYPEAARELRAAGLHMIAAARAATDAVEIPAADDDGVTVH